MYFPLFICSILLTPFCSNTNIFINHEEPKDIIIKEKDIVLRNEVRSFDNNDSLNDINSDRDAWNLAKYNLVTKNLSYENFTGNREFEYGANELDSKTKSRYISQTFDESDELRDVIGDDDRFIVSNPKTNPYISTGLLKVTYYVYNNVSETIVPRVFEGTGFLEGNNLLITAGHNIYDDVTKTYYTSDGQAHTEYEDNVDNDSFPDKVEFFAGLNGEHEKITPYPYYAKGVEIYIQKNYFESKSSNFDWAAIELDRDLGKKTGYYGAISNWGSVNDDIFLFGYPGDIINPEPDTMCEAHGKILYKGIFTYNHNIDTYKQNSGSPIFMIDNDGEMYVCGIHTYGDTSYNSGTKINNFILNFLIDFVENHESENLIATIIPTDYGYPDAYTTNYIDSSEFTTHTLQSGFQFETRRYRTGYIHNEYVVMSDIRREITYANIVYQFAQPIYKIKVQLSHWRELEHEWTYESETSCKLLYRAQTICNLLDAETNLTTNRFAQVTYTFFFPLPTYSFQFRMERVQPHYNNDNRGRVCIGNMYVYSEQ